MTRTRRTALTLLELIVVIVVLVVLAGLVVPMVGNNADEARQNATRESMRRLQDVILNRYWVDMNNVLTGVDGGYPHPAAAVPPKSPSTRQDYPQLRYLFVNPMTETVTSNFDPVAQRGWRGPYLYHGGERYALSGSFTQLYGEADDPTVLDGWGRPIVLQKPTAGSVPEQTQHARLLSAGADGILSTPGNALLPARAVCGDDVVLYLRVADTRP